MAKFKQERKELICRAMTDVTSPCMILINAHNAQSSGCYSPNDTL